MNVYVISNTPTSDPLGQRCRAVLGYKNVLDVSTFSGQEWYETYSASYPFSNVYDYRTNTEWSPLAASGSVTIGFYQTSPSYISYLGIFSKNAEQANLGFSVRVFNNLTSSWVDCGSRASFGDGKPQMLTFDPIFSSYQEITFTFTQRVYIASISMGEAVIFGKTVSTGYQPARNASLDEVSQFSTEGNNFVQGRRITNGHQEKAAIKRLAYEEIDVWWREFMNHVLDSKPFFFMANNQKQTQAIYGIQNPSSLPKPAYTTSALTDDIQFEISGWAS